MSRVHHAESVHRVAEEIPGYDYGEQRVAVSPITVRELEQLEKSAGFTAEDHGWLRVAGEVLADQTRQLVDKWRKVIEEHPHLTRYALLVNGERDERYSEASGLRFQQWVLDTCFRPYDQDWLNYQQEIALRHTSVKKNRTDGAESATTVQLRDVVAFAAVINDSRIIKPFLAAKGHELADVDRMHQAWCKSVLMQVALWTQPYTDPALAADQW